MIYDQFTEGKTFRDYAKVNELSHRWGLIQAFVSSVCNGPDLMAFWSALSPVNLELRTIMWVVSPYLKLISNFDYFAIFYEITFGRGWGDIWGMLMLAVRPKPVEFLPVPLPDNIWGRRWECS
jgi:hypothetical protein